MIFSFSLLFGCKLHWCTQWTSWWAVVCPEPGVTSCIKCFWITRLHQNLEPNQRYTCVLPRYHLLAWQGSWTYFVYPVVKWPAMEESHSCFQNQPEGITAQLDPMIQWSRAGSIPLSPSLVASLSSVTSSNVLNLHSTSLCFSASWRVT